MEDLNAAYDHDKCATLLARLNYSDADAERGRRLPGRLETTGHTGGLMNELRSAVRKYVSYRDQVRPIQAAAGTATTSAIAQAFRRWLETDFRSGKSGQPLGRVAAGDYVSRLRVLSKALSLDVFAAGEVEFAGIVARLDIDAPLRRKLNAGSRKAAADIGVALCALRRFRTADPETGLITPPVDTEFVTRIIGHLEAAGYRRVASTQRLCGLRKGPAIIYVKRRIRSLALVVHPEFEVDYARLVSLPGVRGRSKFEYYHDSNMRLLPERQHTGKGLTHYGLDFNVRDDAVQAFGELVFDLSQERVAATPAGDGLPSGKETQREQLMKARIGQGRFRSDLMSAWGSCPISGIVRPDLLRASHIKPWKSSDDRERLDPDNGLLLGVHLDCLFDKGFISFDDQGRLLISRNLTDAERQTFGLSPAPANITLNAGNRAYLAHHRQHVFLDSALGASENASGRVST